MLGKAHVMDRTIYVVLFYDVGRLEKNNFINYNKYKMKKIKFLLMFLLGVIMSFTFVSCGDDDDDSTSGPYADSPIVGSWQSEFMDGGDKITDTFTFKADGTYTYTSIDSSDPSDVFTERGTFQYDGGSKLTLVTTDSPDKSNLGTESINITVSANSYIIIHGTKFVKK